MVETELRLRPLRSEQQRHSAVRASWRSAGLMALVVLTLGAPSGARAFIPEEEREAADAPQAVTPPTPAPAPAPAPAPVQPQPAASTGSTSDSAARRPITSTTQPPRPEREVAAEGEGRHNRLRLFYLEAYAGYSWVKLGLLRETNLVPEVDRVDETGIAVGGGAGFFVSFVTLGVQAEVAFHDNFNLGTVLLDVGIRLPTKHLEPYLRVGLGYAWLFNSTLIPGVDVTIRGVAANLGVGFDYMITPLLAIGVGADATLFNVRRSGVDGAGSFTDVDLSENGDAIGLQISALAQISLHF